MTLLKFTLLFEKFLRKHNRFDDPEKLVTWILAEDGKSHSPVDPLVFVYWMKTRKIDHRLETVSRYLKLEKGMAERLRMAAYNLAPLDLYSGEREAALKLRKNLLALVRKSKRSFGGRKNRIRKSERYAKNKYETV